jgi:DNA-binding transcriptional LysR family regulator
MWMQVVHGAAPRCSIPAFATMGWLGHRWKRPTPPCWLERLNLSQSAVSHAIAKLEAHHQVRIWRKKGRGLELTQAGRYLLRLAERVVPEFDHAERGLANGTRGHKETMWIGMECHPCEQWLMRVTRPFLTSFLDIARRVTP